MFKKKQQPTPLYNKYFLEAYAENHSTVIWEGSMAVNPDQFQAYTNGGTLERKESNCV